MEWDTGWEAKTAVSDSGYTVEFAIPFKSIRFNPELESWGINFGRFIPKWLETSYWAGPTDWDSRVSNFGNLTGLQFSKTTTELRFIPYLTARQCCLFCLHQG